ncbi:hypothetical protein OG302_10745 [Streptomyces sp. NBC_01283]|uniref:hypothetical protein n=1 Tax=Streptomyces sp. NBC_01283 TaxID=2903812 RepID=UPI00352DEBA3|nr:hypothetical protein OG302_10745 [Streptomyces sp. NBC_01283]
MLDLALQTPAVREPQKNRPQTILFVISQAVRGSQREMPGEAYTGAEAIVVPEYLDQVLLVRLVMRHGFVPPSDPRNEQLPCAEADCSCAVNIQW